MGESHFSETIDGEIPMKMSLKNFDFSNDSTQSVELIEFLDRITSEQPSLQSAKDDGRLGVLLADISEARTPRWAAIDPDLEIYGASVPKLGILLGILHNHASSVDTKKTVLNDFQLSISAMIKQSNNLEAGKLYALASFDSIQTAVKNHGLYDWDETQKGGRGGIWCGAVYSTSETKKWFEENPSIAEKYLPDFAGKCSPKSGQEFALTVRSGASFLLKMVKGELINQQYSEIAKGFMKQISTSKFVKGLLQSDPGAIWFGKTGTYNGHLAEVTLVEGKDYCYILALQLSEYRSNDVFELMARRATDFIRGL